jgi:hypothetical protein
VKTAHEDYSFTPANHEGEKLDCSVRALCCAANMTYSEAYDEMHRVGRKFDRRVSVKRMHNACIASGFLYHATEGKPTLAQFAKANPTGRFVLFVRGHFVALVDGTLHDWPKKTGARTRIRDAWKLDRADHAPKMTIRTALPKAPTPKFSERGAPITPLPWTAENIKEVCADGNREGNMGFAIFAANMHPRLIAALRATLPLLLESGNAYRDAMDLLTELGEAS